VRSRLVNSLYLFDSFRLIRSDWIGIDLDLLFVFAFVLFFLVLFCVRVSYPMPSCPLCPYANDFMLTLDIVIYHHRSLYTTQMYTVLYTH
jgi:hypothetical protein